MKPVAFLPAALCNSHMMVKLGMKSVPGNISSIKLPKPPKAPFHPPKLIKKMTAEMGAQKISENSPRKGIA